MPMQNLTRVVLILLASMFLAVPSMTAAQERSVLVLFSNNRLLPANIEVDRGLRETLVAPGGRGVELFAEFLDHPTFSGTTHERTIATYLSEKYVDRPPQAIVVFGQPALGFLLRHRAQLFPDVPVVHVAVNKSYVQSVQPLPAGVIGVPVEYDYAGTIQQALLWHPNTRRLVIVTGTSQRDRAREADVRVALERVGKHPTVDFLAGLPTDAVVEHLGQLGNGDVVFTPGYYQDGSGRAFLPRDSVQLMAAASRAPVYGPYSTFIGTGIVGGRMPTYIEMARQAGETVKRVLAGASTATLYLPASFPSRVQIDWRQAQKWGIAADAIPADAVVHFREPTFWEKYRNTALLALAVIVVQAGLIAALLVERRLRRRTASALKESEKRMGLAARAAGLSVWMWDCAPQQFKKTGRVRAQAGHADDAPVPFPEVLQTVHSVDREGFIRAVRQAAETNDELDIEYRTLEPSGDVRWIAARGRTTDGGAERLTGVAIDITARKVAELQANKERAALTHMTRVSTLGQLSASIAHELNQRLAAILGNAEVARKMLDREPPDQAELREVFDDIITEDLRAAEVIRRLSALYRRGEVQIAPLNLNELVVETLDVLRTELVTRHVIVDTKLQASLPMIFGGRIQLQQVLLNFILNAADAMCDVEESKRTVIVRTELDGTNVRLCVSDNGTGIAPEDIEKVFDAFWSTKEQGTGVGLAICHSIITAHRGTLTVANNPDGGATFCARWPVQPHS